MELFSLLQMDSYSQHLEEFKFRLEPHSEFMNILGFEPLTNLNI
jgi:hypothetical protein